MLRRKSSSLEIRPRRWLRKQKRRRKTCGEDAKEKSQERAAYAKEVVDEIKWVPSPLSRSSLSPLFSPTLHLCYFRRDHTSSNFAHPTHSRRRAQVIPSGRCTTSPLTVYPPAFSSSLPPPLPAPVLPFSHPFYCIVLIFWSLSPFSCSVISCESKGMRSAALVPLAVETTYMELCYPSPPSGSSLSPSQRNATTQRRNATQCSDAATQRDDATRRKAKGNDKRTPLAVVPWYG